MPRRLLVLARQLRASPLAYFAIAYAGSAALQKGIGFVIFLWLAHSLSVERYATFGLLYALQTGLAALAGAGIVETVIGLMKDRASFQLRGSGLFSAANSVFALLCVPSIAVVIAIYGLVMRESGESGYVLGLVLASGILTAFFAMQATLVRLEEKHFDALALSFLAPLAGLVGGAAGFIRDRNVTSFFAGSALGLLLVLVILAFRGVGYHRFATHPQEVVRITARIAPYILIAALGWLVGYGNTYLVESLFTSTEVAKFTFAYTVSSVMPLVATSMNQVWGPRFFRMVHELPLAKVEASNRRFFALQGAALGSVGGCLLVVLPAALRQAGGNLAVYSGMNVELLLLFCAYAATIPWWHSQNYFYAHNKGKVLMHITLLSSVAGLTLWVVAAWTLGAIGVYVGFVLQMMARTVVAVAWARKEWGIRIAWEGTVVAVVLLVLGALIAATIY